MATSCIAEQAAELVTSDPDLLKQEFEAIVAATPWEMMYLPDLGATRMLRRGISDARAP